VHINTSEAAMAQETVLITGANGNVSGAVLDALKGSELKIRALVRNAARAPGLAARGVEVVEGDLDDAESLKGAFEGVDALWLLTAVGPRAPENNMNAMWAARQAGVKRVVRLSAIGAAHDAPTRNGRLHALSDAEVMASEMKWTILRPHFFMQNMLGSAASIAAQNALYWAMGNGRLGMIDVRDIGEMGARILRDAPADHHGQIYTPTGPAAISLADVAEQLGQALGRCVSYVPVSLEAAREAMLGAGMPPWVVGMMVEYSRAYAAGWGDFTTGHVEDVTGKKPRDFATFARDFKAAFAPAGAEPAARA
jgi:uncharacterized protein YbjT (DUF2867 family)